MRLACVFNHEELNALQYPIIVESWDKAKYGQARRHYLAEFTDPERKYLRELYDMFYRWYLVKGTPQEHTFKPSTIQLIQRAVGFFASI